MATYTAPKPKQNRWKKRLLILPLLGEMLQAVGNFALGKTIMRMVLPAQTFAQFKLSEEDKKTHFDKIFLENKENNDLIHQTHQVMTHDGCCLDTLEIIPKSLVGEYKEGGKVSIDPTQKYIIKFVGNKSSYAIGLDDAYKDVDEKSRPRMPLGTPSGTIKEMISDARELNCRVILFNYRGVSDDKKQATSTNDLFVDGIAQVQRLLDAGVPPENILVKGHSLGGGIGCVTAAYFAKNNEHVFNYTSRTFPYLARLILGNLRRMFVKPNKDGKKSGHKETLGGKIIAFLAWPFVKAIFYLSRCEIPAAESFRSIWNKRYITAKSPAADIAANADIIDDSVMTHYASLPQGLPKKERDINAEVVVKAQDEKAQDIRTIVDAHDAGMHELVHHTNNMSAKASFHQFVNEHFKVMGSSAYFVRKVPGKNEVQFKRGNEFVSPAVKIHNSLTALFNRTIDITVRVMEKGRVEQKTVKFDRESLRKFLEPILPDALVESERSEQDNICFLLDRYTGSLHKHPQVGIHLPPASHPAAISDDSQASLISGAAVKSDEFEGVVPVSHYAASSPALFAAPEDKVPNVHLIAIDVRAFYYYKSHSELHPKVVDDIAEKCRQAAKENRKFKIVLYSQRGFHCEEFYNKFLSFKMQKMGELLNGENPTEQDYLHMDEMIVKDIYSFQQNVILANLSNQLKNKGVTPKYLEFALTASFVDTSAKNMLPVFEKLMADLAILKCYNQNVLFTEVLSFPSTRKKLLDRCMAVLVGLEKILENTMSREEVASLSADFKANYLNMNTDRLKGFVGSFDFYANKARERFQSTKKLTYEQFIEGLTQNENHAELCLTVYDSKSANIDAVVKQYPKDSEVKLRAVLVQDICLLEQRNFEQKGGCVIS